MIGKINNADLAQTQKETTPAQAVKSDSTEQASIFPDTVNSSSAADGSGTATITDVEEMSFLEDLLNFLGILDNTNESKDSAQTEQIDDKKTNLTNSVLAELKATGKYTDEQLENLGKSLPDLDESLLQDMFDKSVKENIDNYNAGEKSINDGMKEWENQNPEPKRDDYNSTEEYEEALHEYNSAKNEQKTKLTNEYGEEHPEYLSAKERHDSVMNSKEEFLKEMDDKFDEENPVDPDASPEEFQKRYEAKQQYLKEQEEKYLNDNPSAAAWTDNENVKDENQEELPNPDDLIKVPYYKLPNPNDLIELPDPGFIEPKPNPDDLKPLPDPGFRRKPNPNEKNPLPDPDFREPDLDPDVLNPLPDPELPYPEELEPSPRELKPLPDVLEQKKLIDINDIEL